MKRIGYLLIVVALFFSCSTDLKVLADYKETTVVYGLLSQSDTAQYIKVNKAFLGAGDALQMAQQFDSVTFGNQLTVQLEQITNGALVNTITLTRDSSIEKPNGIFSSPKQILFKTKAPLNQNSQYNLKIINNSTKNVVTASTSLVSDFAINSPSSSVINFSSTTNKVKIAWDAAVNGKLYGVTIRFYYQEKDLNTSVVTQKYIDWVFANQVTANTDGSENLLVDFYGAEFYQFLQSRLSGNGNVSRFLVNNNSGPDIDIIFSVGGPELSTYIAVSQPSNGIIQEKPQYTNIKNGYGIFSSRYTKIKKGLKLTANSIDLLYKGPNTGDLFCDPLSESCP